MEHEEKVKSAIIALEKDVAARMAKLQLLGYGFIFTQSPNIKENIWVGVYYPNGHYVPGSGGLLKSLASIVMRNWNNHVRINNGWPDAN